MVFLALFVLFFIVSIFVNIYIYFVQKDFKTKKNKRDLTGCEIAHEILDKDSKTYILLTKGVSEYNSLRDTIKLDEDSFDESSLYAIAVSTLKSYEAIDKKNNKIYKNRDKLSKLVFYMIVLSYITLVLGVVLKDFTFGSISIALIVVVTLFDLFLINLYESNISSSIKLISSNGLIDKDEKEDIRKIMKAESLRGLTRLINVIKDLLDTLIPYE